jgi:DtxR family Mn-dependent transcriptional regulator
MRQDGAVSHDLIDTTEMYLRTIFELEEEGIVPLRARIAERLGQSNPTVSQTVSRMERDGLVRVSEDRHLELTDLGRLTAARVMRKHRLAECLLVEILGMDLADVHEEACRWEHVMSEAVERRILTILGDREISPFGNPIPALDDLQGQRTDVIASVRDWRPVAEAAAGVTEPVRVTIRRIGETVQHDAALMGRLRRARALPGQTTLVVMVGDDVVLTPGPDQVLLDASSAAVVAVELAN